jgi:hypothetical protein
MAPLTQTFLEHMAGKIVLGDALLNDDVRALRLVIQARGHRLLPPVDSLLDTRGRECLVGRVRIIDDDDVAALTGEARTHRGDQTLTTRGVGKAVFGVLILFQLES